MNSSLLIVGGGGHGKVVADVARSAGYTVAAYADANEALQSQVVEPGGGVVALTQDTLVEMVRSGAQLPYGAHGVALAIGGNRNRLTLAGLLDGVEAPVLAHNSAVISPSARVGRGTVLLPCAVVNSGASIGVAVIINTAAVIEHDCVIADGSHISPGAVLSGGVHVGLRTWIGAGATVIQGVRIGSDVIVGAGAVVIRDVPDGQTVVGCPAKPIARSNAK